MLRGDRLPHVTKSHAFKLLRSLAGDSRQLPESYLVGKFSRYRVEKEVIAGGTFAVIRKGRYKGTDVAIRTIRVSLEDQKNLDEIHEVRKAACFTTLDD